MIFRILATSAATLMNKIFWKAIGYTAVGLGFAGAFLPLLPTTPFLLLALYCFSKSSPAMKEWLLQNRFFGRYLQNYRQGAGMPPEATFATLGMLWGGIAFSMIVLTDERWVRGILWLTVILLTWHIIRISRRHSRPRIHLLVPTEAEIAHFRKEDFPQIVLTMTGVGMLSTSLALERILNHERPDRVILAGIAGAYPDSGLNIGDCVAVRTERTADTGSFSGGMFSPKFSHAYDCPNPLPTGLPAVTSHCVNSAGAPFLPLDGAQIENMEGAALFAFCQQKAIPCWEIRAISNVVGAPFEQWNLPLATQRLAETLNRLLHEIDA